MSSPERSKRGPSEDKDASDAKRAKPEDGPTQDDKQDEQPEAEAAKADAPAAGGEEAKETDGAAAKEDAPAPAAAAAGDGDDQPPCPPADPTPAATADTQPQPLPAGTPLTDEQIQALVQQREGYRSVQDWNSADRVREQLRGYGIECNDADRSWRSTLDGRSGTVVQGVVGVSAAGGCSLTDEQINAKLAEREEARKQRDYFTGDRIRDELRAAGCQVIDNEKLWRTTDGRTGRIGGGPAPVPMSFNAGGMVGAAPGSGDIEALIQERQAARDRRDYAVSDSLRDKLRAMGVQIRDTEGTWHASDGRSGMLTGGPIQSNPMAGMSIVPGMALSEHQIEALLAQREQARSNKDFATGDRIREQLRSCGVTVRDTEKTWHAADGRNGMIGALTGGMYQPAQQPMQAQNPAAMMQQYAAYYQQMGYTPEQISAYMQMYAGQQA